MGQIHIKGRILQLLKERNELWDYEICEFIMSEYAMKGDYWRGVMRVHLIDLLSGGLVEGVEEALDEKEYFGKDKLVFKYRITDFGRSRMIDTGLAQV